MARDSCSYGRHSSTRMVREQARARATPHSVPPPPATPYHAAFNPWPSKCFFVSIGRGLKDVFKNSLLSEIKSLLSGFFSQWPVPG